MRIIFTKLRGLVFFIITLFKRALCCFKRRRRSSCDSVPLTHVGIVPDQGPIPNEPQEWTEWDHSSNPSQDPKTRTIQQQIEMYRQQTIAAHQVRDEPGGTNEEDLFNDMAPNITRQKKVFVSTSAQDKARGDRFALDPNVNVNVSCEQWVLFLVCAENVVKSVLETSVG